ncbi:MAG TPA: glycosyltransferase family 4 protein [Candidatus Elarobacter sp.]|nr:glycosyltransferase family 4 protein [Candidatus Elarobacter sp.]
MKLLVAHNHYRQSGGEDEVFLRESELLRSAGHEVLEYKEHNREISEDGIPSKVQLAARTFWATDSIARLRSLLRREKPDLVHFHNTFPLISPAAYYACHQEGVPVVQSLHNSRLICPAATLYRNGSACEDCLGKTVPWPGVVHACYHNSRLQTAVVAGMLAGHRVLGTWQEQVDAYIVFTEFFRQKFIAAGLPRKKIFVKPHFLSTDPGMKQNIGDYALFLGRLAAEKGVRTLLQAFALLQNAIPLHIVGDGPLRAELEAQKSRACLSSVSFHGWLPRDQTLKIMRRARFLIFPSEWSEPFGLTIIEAFGTGLPVIASRLGSVGEVIEEGKTGLYFAAGDPTDLASKVRWAWTHVGQMEVMGRAGRAEYKSKYTSERNCRLLMEIYRHARSATTRKVA